MNKKTLNIFFHVIIFLIFLNSYSQEKRAENVYQDCLYDNLPNDGKALKKYIKGFENHLIEKKILKDSTGISYKFLFKEVVKGKKFPYQYSYSYRDSLNSLPMKILPNNQKCLKKMQKDISFANYFLRFFDKKHYEEEVEGKNKMDIDQNKVLENFYTKLNSDDFKLDFYKHRLFMILYFTDDPF